MMTERDECAGGGSLHSVDAAVCVCGTVAQMLQCVCDGVSASLNPHGDPAPHRAPCMHRSKG